MSQARGVISTPSVDSVGAARKNDWGSVELGRVGVKLPRLVVTRDVEWNKPIWIRNSTWYRLTTMWELRKQSRSSRNVSVVIDKSSKVFQCRQSTIIDQFSNKLSARHRDFTTFWFPFLFGRFHLTKIEIVNLKLSRQWLISTWLTLGKEHSTCGNRCFPSRLRQTTTLTQPRFVTNHPSRHCCI